MPTFWWDALRASHALGASVSFSTKLEPVVGFEPTTYSLSAMPTAVGIADPRRPSGRRDERVVPIKLKFWSREWDLNPRSIAYEAIALPLSYLGVKVLILYEDPR